MHICYPRAAVAVTVNGEHPHTDPSLSRRRASPPKPPAYWASRAFDTRHGRLIGFRVSASQVQVAIVSAGSEGLRWIDADKVLSETAARWWLRTSSFSRR